MEMFIVIGFLCFAGLLFYFRYTDARNVTVQSLKNYLKQSEDHIESFLKKKEKDFEDKMIVSEIVIERMNRLAVSLQEKLDLFDEDLIKGKDLFDSLKREITDISDELFEYKQIRTEFKDIEEKISSVFNMKQQAELGMQELAKLRESIAGFSDEYSAVSEELKLQSKKELEEFFSNMQADLSSYLGMAKKELSEKDVEIAEQVRELGDASKSISERIKDFKEYAKSSIDKLKISYNDDLEMLKMYSQTNLEEIYDMWLKLKEDTQKDKNFLEADLLQKEQFFKESEEQLRMEIEIFRERIENFSLEVQTNIAFNLEQKGHELDNKIAEVSQNLELKGETIKSRVHQELNEQVGEVKLELERVHSAFVEQENSIEERIKILGNRITESISLGEQKFQTKVDEMKHSIVETKQYADQILTESRQKIQENILNFEDSFREQAQENMVRIEDAFREENQERMLQSINEITANLETEYKLKYQNIVDTIFQEAQNLDDIVKERLNNVENLDKRVSEINDNFNSEKDKILLMVMELEKDRDNNIQIISHQMSEYARGLQNNIEMSLQEFFDQGLESIVQERELWQERFEETLKEARDMYHIIQHDVEQIRRYMQDIEDTALSSLRNESGRLAQDVERRIDDLKRYTSDHMRVSKEEFQHQIEYAKQEIKELKQELWDQEKEMRDTAHKDFERLTTRVKDVDKQFQVFIKKTEKLDRAEDLMNKLNLRYNEILDLKKEMQHLSGNLKDTYNSGNQIIDHMNQVKLDLESRVESLSMHSSEADRMQEFLLSAVNEAKTVVSVFQNLKEEKIQAQEIENLLLKNLELFNDLQDSLQQLESRKKMVENMIMSINDSENTLSTLSGSTDSIVDRIQEINSYSHELQEKLGVLQSEMKVIAGEHTKIHSAVSKIHDLEHIVVHIDEEMKRLEKMRDWIAKAMNNVERIGSGSGIAGAPKNNNTDLEDANVKNILRLYDQNWSIADIAKNLKLSNAFVELILERYRS